MLKVIITLNGELFQEVAGYASQELVELNEFFSQEIQQRATHLLPAVPSIWMAREQWKALVRGVQCSLCADKTSQEPVDRGSNPRSVGDSLV